MKDRKQNILIKLKHCRQVILHKGVGCWEKCIALGTLVLHHDVNSIWDLTFFYLYWFFSRIFFCLFLLLDFNSSWNSILIMHWSRNRCAVMKGCLLEIIACQFRRDLTKWCILFLETQTQEPDDLGLQNCLAWITPTKLLNDQSKKKAAIYSLKENILCRQSLHASKHIFVPLVISHVMKTKVNQRERKDIYWYIWQKALATSEKL